MPVRIQRQRKAGWRMPEGAKYVGRPSRWGNPFRIYRGHSSIGPKWHVAVDTWHHLPAQHCIYGYVTSSAPLGADAAVALFRDVLKVRARDRSARLRDWLAPLVGHDLACWCPLSQPCHADVLLAFAAEVSVEDRREIAADTLHDRTNDARDRYQEDNP